LDLGGRVGLGGRRRDARVGEPVVGGQRLEEVDGLLEKVGDFFGRLVLRVAGRVEGGDAGACGIMSVGALSCLGRLAILFVPCLPNSCSQKVSAVPELDTQYCCM
jgi:hypothetical protein